MKKITLVGLLLLVVSFACNKEEKFPTKSDLKGIWEHVDGIRYYDELTFDNKSVFLMGWGGNYEVKDTSHYRLNITAKTMQYTSGSEEGFIFKIWIEKNTGLLYISHINSMQQDATVIQPKIYRKKQQL